jgi:hypothetical protein
MTSTWTFRMCLGFALAAAIACGTQAPPPGVDVTGTWVGPIESTAGPPGFEPVFGTYTLTLHLVQAGSGVTGSFASNAFSGTITGGVSGDRAILTVAVAPCGGPAGPPRTVSLTGTVRNIGLAAEAMDVTYQGTPCGVADYGAGTLLRP